MEGTAHIQFAGAGPLPDSLIFYLHGELSVQSAMAGKAELDGHQSRVYFPDDYSLIARRIALSTAKSPAHEPVTITYEGYFNPSKVRSPSDYMRIDRDGVFLRSFGYSIWFPVFCESDEDPGSTDFSEVVIRTPERYKAVFTGSRLSEKVVNGIRITRWSAGETKIFDAQCTAQPFDEFEAGGVRVLALPDDTSRATADEILSFSRDALAFFEESYKEGARESQTYVMQMPKYGDISSGNVTGLSSSRWRNFTTSPGARETIAHELVHPYVQPTVPRDDPIYALIIEGFPSYFHLPFLESDLGEEWYSQKLHKIEAEYIRKRETGVTRRGAELPPEVPLMEIAPDEIGSYKDLFVLDDRAVLFLAYLRRSMGNIRFDTFTRTLCSEDRITYDIFLNHINREAPEEFESVRRWLTGTEFPDRFRVHADH